MTPRLQELIDLIQSFEKDFDKFYTKENKSAGTRVRKHMATLKRKAQEIRNEIQALKKGGDDEPAAEPVMNAAPTPGPTETPGM